MEKSRSPRNKTLQLTPEDRQRLSSQLISPTALQAADGLSGVVCGDSLQLAGDFPLGFVDLLILDPPYNLNRKFGSRSYRKQPIEAYSEWLDQVLGAFLPALKPNASVYICGDWLTSVSIFEVANRHLIVRNRITWEREKGRGAKRNWKNNAEDIWF